jgi:hypothetical protein
MAKGITLSLLLIGSLFGLLAAAASYLISLREYQHHFASRRKAERLAWSTAATVLCLFLGLAFLLAFILPAWSGK